MDEKLLSTASRGGGVRSGYLPGRIHEGEVSGIGSMCGLVCFRLWRQEKDGGPCSSGPVS